MRISVITVCFNSARTIERTLKSVDEQTWPNIEHIVVDGASTDETMEIVSARPKPWRLVTSESDKGIYDAMNKGLARATGDVVGFLNSDDVYAAQDTLTTISLALNEHSVDACYGDLIYVNSKYPDRIHRYWKSQPYESGLCANGWMPAHPTFYARRSVYERFGGFDASMKLQADFEMALRLLDVARISTHYIPRILVEMQTGGASNANWRNVLRGNLEAARACRKHGLPGNLGFVARKLWSRLPQFFAKPPDD